jgi:hypothetical protein
MPHEVEYLEQLEEDILVGDLVGGSLEEVLVDSLEGVLVEGSLEEDNQLAADIHGLVVVDILEGDIQPVGKVVVVPIQAVEAAEAGSHHMEVVDYMP